MSNPYLFACGVPRSGTTLLQRMLNHHPDLAVANDTHFIPRALELSDKSLVQQAENGEVIPLTRELIENVVHYHRFGRLGVNESEVEEIAKRCETYQQLIPGLYDLFARNNNKSLAGEKTPDYVRRLSLLHGLFPTAKLIHIVRDGRNVALSLLDWATPAKGPGRIALWGQHPIAVCALWWRWLVMASQAQRTTIASNVYAEVQYEELVLNPVAEMQRLCQFLDLTYSDQMVEYHKGKSQERISLSAKSAWLAPQQGLRDWQSAMTNEQVDLFEALAGDALQHFGYQLRRTAVSTQTQETAQRCQNWWNENFLPKHRPTNPATDEKEIQLELIRQSGVNSIG
jgi:hypothetical protein